MIVFNCSQAFAEFIETKKADPTSLVGEAAVREKIRVSYLKRRQPQGVPSW